MQATQDRMLGHVGELSSEPRPAVVPGWGALGALLGREITRFFRQPTRPIAAVATPLMILVFLAAGFARTFAPAGDASGLAQGVGEPGSYGSFALAGMISLAVMFSAIFSAISLIEDRNSGFLQGVLVSATPRWALVGAKVGAGSLLAAAQGALLLPALPILGIWPDPLSLLIAMAALTCLAIGVCGLALALAWRVDSIQGFHGIMNGVLMPMWLLSGSVFQVAGSAGWLRALMLANPLTWPTEAARHALTGAAGLPEAVGGLVWPLTIAFAAVGVGLALAMMRRSG
ncbi:MAG: ABC transporter permease [Planctomycetota bacterium]|nr:ABC transporter permease [Planctomycetota bacterium]